MHLKDHFLLSKSKHQIDGKYRLTTTAIYIISNGSKPRSQCIDSNPTNNARNPKLNSIKYKRYSQTSRAIHWEKNYLLIMQKIIGKVFLNLLYTTKKYFAKRLKESSRILTISHMQFQKQLA